jgi:integrase
MQAIPDIWLSFMRNGYKRRDGKGGVSIAVKFEKKQIKYVKTGFYIDPRYWDREKQEVNKLCPEHREFNLTLKTKVYEAEKYLYDNIVKKGRYVEWIELEGILRSVAEKEYDGSFNSFSRKHLEKRILPNGREMKKATYDSKSVTLRKLDEYNPCITFGQVDPDFIEDFRRYLFGKGNSHNTVAKHIKTIKSFIDQAKYEKIIDYNRPIITRRNRVGFIKTKTEWLRPEELKKIASYKCKGYEWMTRNRFLFACFTGLSHTDINGMSERSLVNYGKGYVIRKKRVKTDGECEIPIHKLFCGIGEVLFEKLKQTGFKVVSNSSDNKNLQTILKATGISRAEQISFHTARHTFMTTMSGVLNNPYRLMEYTGLFRMNTALRYIHQTRGLFDEEIDWQEMVDILKNEEEDKIN